MTATPYHLPNAAVFNIHWNNNNNGWGEMDFGLSKSLGSRQVGRAY
jgi:hypothetical protein